MEGFDPRARLALYAIRKGPGSPEDVWLHCTRGAGEFFSFDRLPNNSSGTRRGVGPQVAQFRYRIALRDEMWGDRPKAVRFGLGSGGTQSTLFVLAEHLDAVGAPWLWLCNEFGNRLPNHCLCSKNTTSAA